ncbi:hypothetical protein PCI56_13490 [Plesiomonas shigelloides subsp. oncorhynchi]|nr:hypothetical protein [Plesiomonas shigelloides]
MWHIRYRALDLRSNAKGTSNRPKLTLANVGGLLTGLNAEFDDLVGAMVTRRQVYARFLDAVNFPQGMPMQIRRRKWYCALR